MPEWLTRITHEQRTHKQNTPLMDSRLRGNDDLARNDLRFQQPPKFVLIHIYHTLRVPWQTTQCHHSPRILLYPY